VPYKGGAEVLPAVAANQVQLSVIGAAGAVSFIRSNRVKALAVLSARRLPAIPDVPTFGEVGLAGFENRAAWNGLVVPANTSKALVDQIARDVAVVINEPEFLNRFITTAGLEPMVLMPGEFAEYLNADRRKHGAEIRKLNIRLD
jgi:tripartite-type tricarboxylate transporter receptor subunit TctC